MIDTSRSIELNPFDHYCPWQPPKGIDEFQTSLILSAYPLGTEIVEIGSYRPGYQDYPYRVQIRLADGRESTCVLKADPLVGGVECEAGLLPVLARLGLAVPRLLAGPTHHPDYPHAGPLAVLSELPGKPLPWINATLSEADLTCQLHQQAIARLHGLTEPILHSAAKRYLCGKRARRVLPASHIEGIR